MAAVARSHERRRALHWHCGRIEPRVCSRLHICGDTAGRLATGLVLTPALLRFGVKPKPSLSRTEGVSPL